MTNEEREELRRKMAARQQNNSGNTGNMNSNQKTCPNCGSVIPANYDVCPVCGAVLRQGVPVRNTFEQSTQQGQPVQQVQIVKPKKKFYKRWWFWLIVVIVVFGVAGTAGSDNGEETVVQESNYPTTSNPAETPSQAEESQPVEYTPVNANDMITMLDENPVVAAETYKDKYLEITGELGSIDSSGDYISVERTDDEITFTNIMCYIQNDEQLEAIKTLKRGDTVTVRGKCTDVGEVLGYFLDIDSIVQ